MMVNSICGHLERPHEARNRCKSCYHKEFGKAWYLRNLKRERRKRKRHYLANKPMYEASRKKSKARGRELLNVLKSVPCADCGNTFPPVCMDFDHRPGTDKKFEIGQNSACGLATLKAEIAKCDVVCACCHRLRTQGRLGAIKNEKENS